MKAKLHMPAYYALPYLLILVGCGAEPSINVVNQSKAPDELALAIVEESLEALGAPRNLLVDYRLEMLSEPGSACGVQGCLIADQKRILVVFRDGFPESLSAWHVCHEIVHVFLNAGSHNQGSVFAKCEAVEAAFGG